MLRGDHPFLGVSKKTFSNPKLTYFTWQCQLFRQAKPLAVYLTYSFIPQVREFSLLYLQMLSAEKLTTQLLPPWSKTPSSLT